jgi:hypothetical protein
VSPGAQSPHEFASDPRDYKDKYVITGIHPARIASAAPAHSPANVASFFVQAKEALNRRHFDAAGAMCRKAVDVATKQIDPTLKGVLQVRIDKLEAAHKITPALKDWAHAIRLDGNEAAHDERPFAEDDAKQLVSFTEIFLMYTYTLPGMLVERAAAAQASSA